MQRSADVLEIAIATEQARWRGLYRVGVAGAIVTVASIVAGIVTYLLWPPPTTASVADWFAIFQNNWLVGMIDLDLVLLISYVAQIPVLLALYVALHRTSESLMLLALAFGMVAIATYFAASRVFELAALSSQYAMASDAQKASLTAAGQSMLTTYLGAFAPPAPIANLSYQGTAFNISFVLWSVTGVMVAFAMLRSTAFGKAAGYAGIAGNVAACGLFVPVIGVYLSLLSLPLLLVWYVQIAVTLRQLGN